MKNLAFIILISLFGYKSLAQISSAYKTQVETIFQVNRSYVTTGLLQDYGILFTNVEKFNGVRSDTSYLEFTEWQSVYNSLYTYRFNSTATLTDPATVFNQITSVANQNAGSIVFSGFHFRYERFKSNAVSSNLVYISSNKIYDRAGRPTTPYEIKEAFALVPYRSIVEGATQTFLFKPELFYSNTGKTISNLKVDFNDGAGYRTLTINIPMVITYSTNGEKKLIFKVTYTDASSVESHTKIEVKGISTSPYAPSNYAGLNINEFHFPLPTSIFSVPIKPYQGLVGGLIAGGALVTIEYINPDKIIRKPLIILGGLDPWRIISPDEPNKNFSFQSVINGTKGGGIDVLINTSTGQRLSAALQSENYDLIFVDYDEGTDYIQRNAYVLENVIQWVNSVKKPLNGVSQKNVIIGFSMGGIVARYALCDMEKNPLIPHDTRLNVSFDSPHQGSNIPVGFQAAVLNLAGSGFSVGILGVTNGLFFGDIFPKLGKARDLENAPASRQLLRYQVTGSGDGIQLDNSQHTAFMSEYHLMGLPSQGGIRNVAIADGSECGTKQPFAENASFINVIGNLNFQYWAIYSV